ncbi:XrtA system polysaccharide deacetylase [Reinekea blandensis]|uniref:Predicted xylanase/chitin deacetylase n=1 Tax=Reinekea blandensis MED297 TaxID=314283 RepID=A4B974_9GAMM|nr:XrtA system polysaccharide deacetylase [Reinekea blandensis]EAR11175.1 predicted xylanase/chitin deacetylase [Reinekea sp. MED297] [Reinekea blandensis MED297]
MLNSTDRNSATSAIHAMTIDVEDYFHVAALSRVVPPNQWDRQPSRVVDNTRRLLDLFNEKQIRATFFVLGWVAEREPELIRDIANAGHEVASHGYSHQLIYRQSPEVFREETRRSKEILESIIQKPVEGYRAASYSITNKSLWALDILAELGFRWDSSIFPIYHDNYGIPDTPCEPYTIQTRSGQTLTEFPITSAKAFGLSIPAAGGGYFRQFPYLVFRYLFRLASENNRTPKIFYLHPWEIDPDQPRFNNASWLSRFRHYTNLHRCEARLNRLIDDFEFSTLTESLQSHLPTERYTNLESNLVRLA